MDAKSSVVFLERFPAVRRKEAPSPGNLKCILPSERRQYSGGAHSRLPTTWHHRKGEGQLRGLDWPWVEGNWSVQSSASTPSVKQSSAYTTVHTQGCTQHCTHNTAHSAVHTQGCTLSGVHTGVHTQHCTLNSVHTVVHTQQCTHRSAHTAVHTHSLHTAVHTAQENRS